MRRSTAKIEGSPVRDVATGRKKPSGDLSGAQDPLCEEAQVGPWVTLRVGSDVGIITQGFGS